MNLIAFYSYRNIKKCFTFQRLYNKVYGKRLSISQLCKHNHPEVSIPSFTFMHRSIPTAPSPPPTSAPGNCGAFVRFGDPVGGAFVNFARPEGRALANLGGTPRAFYTHVLYISKTWGISVVKVSAWWRIG